MGWVVNATPRPLNSGNDPVPIVQEVGWVPGPVWTGAEYLAPTGIQSKEKASDSSVIQKEKNTAVLSTHDHRTPLHTP